MNLGKKSKILGVVLLVVLLVTMAGMAVPVYASTFSTYDNNRPGFDAAIAGLPSTELDFDELPDYEWVTDDYSDMGVVFSARPVSSSWYGVHPLYPTARYGNGSLSGSNPVSWPIGVGVPWDSDTRSELYVDFSTPVSFVGAYFIDNISQIEVRIFDIDDNEIGFFHISSGSESGDSGEWWGVVVNERVIARMTFEVESYGDFFAIDNFVFSVLPVEVLIDIKPGSDPNSFNNDGHGVIPVAILTTDSFDAATVDPFSVSLNGAAVRVKGKSGNAGSLEDVDNDGDLDLVVQIEDVDGTYQAGDTLATLTGVTVDGFDIVGQDTIRIVP